MAKKILIVDNAAEYRQLLQQVVDAMGYEALLAGSASAARQILGREPVSLVLLDIKMPAMPGDLFLKYMRHQGSDTAVIAVSGYLTPETLQNLKRHGVSKVIAKPFKIRRLAADIHDVIGDPDA